MAAEQVMKVKETGQEEQTKQTKRETHNHGTLWRKWPNGHKILTI